MWRRMLCIFLWVSVARLILSQSGDDDWGSGLEVSTPRLAVAGNTSMTAGTELWRRTDSHALFSPAPIMLYEDQSDACSTHFNTNTRVSARWLKAQREELSYMRAIQHGNQAIVENLAQYVSAEVGEQRYEDIIQENIVGIKEDHASCQGATQKALEDLQKQLEGDVMETLTGMHKIREELAAFEGMRRSVADAAARLELAVPALQASFTRKLRNTALRRYRG
ncbi:unnamed protein product [Lota lota]